MKKRILSLLLALVMVIGLLPAAVTQASAASAGNGWTITVEKYDADGNGTYLLEPTVVDYYYYKDWVPGIINYYWGNDYSKVEYDSHRNEYYITKIVDDSQADGWLDNGDLGENSKWKIVWNDTVLADKPSGCYASRGAVIRYIFSVNGDAAEAGVSKNELLQYLAELTDAEKSKAAAAYAAAKTVALDPDATEKQVSDAIDAVEAVLHPAATGVQISSSEVTVGIGKTVQLSATLEPEGASGTVSWSVADTSIATVDKNGLLRGVAEGNTTVTAQVGETVSDSVSVRVVRVAATALQAQDATVKAGESVQLTATVTPEDATDPVTWSFKTATDIATLTEDGLASGLKPGTATVVASCNGLTSEATLTVVAQPYVYFEYSDGRAPQRMAEDGSFTLGALDQGYFRVACVNDTPWWENEEVIDAGNGSVTYHWYVNRETGEWQPSGQKPTKPIVVTAGDFTQSFTIKYETASGVTELKTYIDGIEVSDDAPYEVTGCVSNVAVTTKGLKDGEWIDIPVQALNYDTSDNIYYNFRFVGNCLEINRAGNATMTVSLKGENVSTTFKVVCNPVLATAMKVIVPETFEIAEWDAVPNQYVGIRPFSEGGYDIEFTPANATNRDVTWTALTPEVAEHFTTHSAGIVPKKAGTATFTVTNTLDATLTQDVTVTFTYKNPLTDAGVEDLTMDPGQTRDLTVSVTPANATEQRFDWTYSRGGIVEVTDKINTSEDGMSYWTTHTIKALNSGTVTVTGVPYDTTGGVESVSFTVTVTGDSEIAEQDVRVVEGKTVTTTDMTGDYSDFSLTGLDESVAKVELAPKPYTKTIGTVGAGNGSFTGPTVDLSDCLYTFTKNSDGTSWTVTGTDAAGNTVYLYPGNGKDAANGDRSSGYPNTASVPEGMYITIAEGSETGSFYISSNVNAWDNGNGAYLYFNRSSYRWDRVESVGTNTTFQTNCSLYLYRAAGADETSSTEIPGYVRVTGVADVTEGQYLIVAPGAYSGYYAAYPNTSTESLYCQIVKTGVTTVNGTEIRVTGVSAGVTSVVVGHTQYNITVRKDLAAEWPSFRGNDQNNGVTSAATPRTEAETNEKWVRKISTGWSDAPSPMILVDGCVVTMSGSTLYKLDSGTGNTVASATMDAACSWGTTPPLYADGTIFCQLGGGKVQAFDAGTLENLWVYTDENGGQAQSPIAYSDGMVYVGFGYGNSYAFVCLDASDGSLIWRDVDSQGYYWAGAVVAGDYVICGTDNGTVISRNKLTGEVVTTLEVGNKVRSSICYENGKIYFADYAANLCYADLNTATGELTGLTKIDCSAYGSSSTSTPVVYKGIAYIGVGGWSGNKSIVAVNVSTGSVLWNIDEPAYPQCSVLLSTAYEATDGYIYLYVTYNNYPGGVNVIKAKADGSEATQETLYTPDSSYQQYCISSVIAGSDGTLYYKNDSGAIFALEKKTAPVAPVTYTVTVSAGYGYAVKPEEGYTTTVEDGGDFKFTVEIEAGYDYGDDFAVTANSVELTPDASGVYTVAGITGDVTIAVAGVVQLPDPEPVTVYFSISNDAAYLTGSETGTVMALQELEVPYFDLANYGLEGFYYKSSSYTGSTQGGGTAQSAYGKITMLHLFLYATEVCYYGVDPDEAGQGYLKDEGILGTNVLNIGGSSGSMFLNNIWNMDMNLNYYLNYEYPLASSGWGATADQILLEDGDVVTLGHFSGWSFYFDSASVFNYIKAGDETVSTTVTQGDPLKLSLYRAGTNSDYTTKHTPVTSQPDVYYVNLEELSTGDVTKWTKLGTAGEDGALSVDTVKLPAGEYLIALAGQPGQENPSDICSTPGAIRLTVQAHTHQFDQKNTDEKYLKDPATCTEDAVYYYSCSICGEKGEETFVAEGTATGHSFGEWTVTKEATCTESGEEARTCANCGETETREIEALGHAYEEVVTPPTCTEHGHTTHTCSRCGDSYVDNETEPTGHDWSDWETVDAPNCEDKGFRQRICHVCGVTETEDLDPTGHDWEDHYTIDVEPTCTTDGSQSIHCRQCDAKKDSQVIPATGHEGVYVNQKMPTSTQNGYSGDLVCRHCGKLLEKGHVIPATGKPAGGSAAATTPTTPANSFPFVDVKTSDWFYDEVKYVYEKGLMTGTSATLFSPSLTTTRGMIVTILARLEGVDTTKGSIWYEAGQKWAMENGISDGTNMTAEITREQLATILYRYAKFKGYDVSKSNSLSGFTDSGKVSDWALEAMQWANAEGLINGKGNNLLDPQGKATRAETAAILMRFMKNVAKLDD